MVFWNFQCGKTLVAQMSDGQYLIVVEQAVDEVGMFDMSKTFVCSVRNITCTGGTTLLDLDEENRGFYKMWTVANVIAFCGEEKGFSFVGNVICQRDKSGKKLFGLLIGPLNLMLEEQRKKIMSSVNSDIGYITTDMWYIHDCKGSVVNPKKTKIQTDTRV